MFNAGRNASVFMALVQTFTTQNRLITRENVTVLLVCTLNFSMCHNMRPIDPLETSPGFFSDCNRRKNTFQDRMN